MDPFGNGLECATLGYGSPSRWVWTGSDYAIVVNDGYTSGHLVRFNVMGNRVLSDVEVPAPAGALSWIGQELAIFSPGYVTRVDSSDGAVQTKAIPGVRDQAVWTGSECGALSRDGQFSRIGCQCTQDADGDGFTSCSDCDDSRASVYP